MSSTAFCFYVGTKIRWSIWHGHPQHFKQGVAGSICNSKTPKLCVEHFWGVCYFSLDCRRPRSPRSTLYSSRVKHTVMASIGHHYKLTCHYWFCESTNGFETDVTMHSGSRDSPNNFLNNWPAGLLLNLITITPQWRPHTVRLMVWMKNKCHILSLISWKHELPIGTF